MSSILRQLLNIFKFGNPQGSGEKEHKCCLCGLVFFSTGMSDICDPCWERKMKIKWTSLLKEGRDEEALKMLQEILKKINGGKSGTRDNKN